MKTIGLIGGLSWESSSEYYRIINQEVQKRLGGLHSADCLLYSFDFAEIEAQQAAGDWQAAAQMILQAAQRLQAAGAGCIVICSNTMHQSADSIEAAISLPLLHIADATAQPILAQGYQRVGLLGTRFTMEQPFYTQRLQQRFGIQTLTPVASARQALHDIIFQELVRGIIQPESRQVLVRMIDSLRLQGAQALILGCTEISLLIKPADSSLPSFDSTELHALAAVDWALAA